MGLNTKQQRIVDTLEGPLFVSAGAGSGKTFVLTQRIMHALRPGSKPQGQWTDPNVPEPFLDSIDQVLAITFTKKAAAELKERIRSALLEAGMDEEAEKVDDAWISTIHSMCRRIIGAHALDLGVDPAFDDVEYADDLRRSAVEHVLRRAVLEHEAGTSPYGALFEAFEVETTGGKGFGSSSLLSIVTDMLSSVSSSIHSLDDFSQVKPNPSYILLMEAYRDIAEELTPANAEKARCALDALEVYAASEHDLPALRACFEACGKLKRAGGDDVKAAIDEVNFQRDAFFTEAYLALRNDASEQLLKLASEAQHEFEQLKEQQSLLEQDDLLTRAYDALKNDPLVRVEFAGRFKMVMVDEFQDTAQQQVELVRLLCSTDARELCTVGDAQQSIYRFRGADVSVFRNKKCDVEGTGTVCSLDINYRSHADILSYADAIFGGKDNPLGRDFLHLESCGEQNRKGARTLGRATSRRQAVLTAGGTADKRAEQNARAIAARLARLREEEGFAPADMVILMRRLNNAEVYAQAVRAVGMPCVISGGTSVFRDAPEVAVISALLAFLANPDDGQNGLMPLITSPMLGLGATELLALATHRDEDAGIIDSRALAGDTFLSGELFEEFGDLPLLTRAREVLGRALSRIARDPLPCIVRDVVHESGWLYRLEQSGAAQDRAVAANILKALDIVERESAGREFAPRLVARAFDNHVRNIKESPATLNGGDGDAVRIMTVHSSKGLEFPVVVVAECDGISDDKGALFHSIEQGDRIRWVAKPAKHALPGDEKLLQMPKYSRDTLPATLPATASEAFAYMKFRSRELDYEEAARLLYVAITRAREVAILALSTRYAAELAPNHSTSLVGEVLSRILPADPDNNDLPDLASTTLAFSDSKPGDFEFILLDDELNYPDSKGPHRTYYGEEFGPAPDEAAADEEGPLTRHFALVTPAEVSVSMTPAERAPRSSYSYSSVSKELHAEAEDHHAADRLRTSEEREPAVRGDAADVAPADAVQPRTGEQRKDGGNDATALGSVFHDACQWMIEMGADRVPAETVDALCRFWGCSAEQRVRIDAALERWYTSNVRAEALSWPCVRAEVPFYSRGMDGLAERFAPYAEGAIDLLCTDPAQPDRALVIDYKTGGSPAETPEQLQDKHELQAHVYADVLNKQGIEHVTLKFVRVEQTDVNDPTQPQVVTYVL